MISIYDLSDIELEQAFESSLKVVREQLEKRATYAQLAARIGVGESALKQFVARGDRRDGQPLRRGRAFEQIHRFSQAAADVGPGLVPASRRISEIQLGMIYKTILKMLGVQDDAQRLCCEKVFDRGPFYCFRHGTASDSIVVSQIGFDTVDPVDPEVRQFSHIYPAADGSWKQSDGAAFVLHKNIYLIGDIGLGEGTEMFALHEPLGKQARYVVGLLTTIGAKHRPQSANVLVVHYSAFGLDRVPDRIVPGSQSNADPLAGTYPFDRISKASTPTNPDFGKQLLAQLAIPPGSNVLQAGELMLVDHGPDTLFRVFPAQSTGPEPLAE